MSAAFELYWTKCKGGQASKRKQSDKKRIEFQDNIIIQMFVTTKSTLRMQQQCLKQLFFSCYNTQKSQVEKKNLISFCTDTKKNSTQNTIECMTVKGLLMQSMDFRRKKSQSQNSIQHFVFSRTFFSTGRPAIPPAEPLLLDCQC